MAQSAVQREAFWEMATAPLPGMDRHNADLVRFYTKQLVEATSPAHWLLTNPDVLAQTRAKRGMNLLTGAGRIAGRALKQLGRKPEEQDKFRVGQDLAATPGTVVFRNELMELIQYKPITPTVLSEPIVIVPAWIMKYYILDLSAKNSLVRWLVAKGHTVFMVSWKNPDSSDRDRGMDDYYRLGVKTALETASSTCDAKVHAVGYCVGGTLLAMAAARMAGRQDSPIKTLTLFTAQTDFQDAGELGVFINEMNLYWLDRQMSKRGYLEGRQMATAFGLLRARELIWSGIVQKYLVGAEDATFDVMAWNADVTRMPHRMHSDYLRELYIENRLSQGKYQLDGASISIGDVSAPLFAVSTANDHIAPWRSVYKIRNLKRRGETTFVLAAGGHNTGIVSEPGRPRRRFQLGSWDEATMYQSPDEWAASQAYIEGSWWPSWGAWLEENSTTEQRKPPTPRADLCAAPGTYVFQR